MNRPTSPMNQHRSVPTLYVEIGESRVHRKCTEPPFVDTFCKPYGKANIVPCTGCFLQRLDQPWCMLNRNRRFVGPPSASIFEPGAKQKTSINQDPEEVVVRMLTTRQKVIPFLLTKKSPRKVFHAKRRKRPLFRHSHKVPTIHRNGVFNEMHQPSSRFIVQ